MVFVLHLAVGTVGRVSGDFQILKNPVCPSIEVVNCCGVWFSLKSSVSL